MEYMLDISNVYVKYMVENMETGTNGEIVTLAHCFLKLIKTIQNIPICLFSFILLKGKLTPHTPNTSQELHTANIQLFN